MMFETSKVIYDCMKVFPSEETKGAEYYFHNNLLALNKAVENESLDFRGKLVDVEDSDEPFVLRTPEGEIAHASLIYPIPIDETKVIVPVYRPFKDISEVYKVVYEKWGKNTPEDARPFVWIFHKESGNVLLITGYLNNGIFADNFYSFEELFDNFLFLDGSYCGVSE